MAEKPARDESLSELLKDLRTDVARLVDSEKALAKKELSVKADELKRDGMKLGAAAALAALGGFCVTAAAVLALAHAIPAWLSALLIGIALLAIAGILAAKFRSDARHFEMTPQHGRVGRWIPR